MVEENLGKPWIEFTLTELAPDEDTKVPFRLVANVFKSSSPDSENIIHDPLDSLMKAQETEGLLRDVTLNREEWKVTTHVVNHHQPLTATHLYAMVTVDSNEQMVGVQLVKKGP